MDLLRRKLVHLKVVGFPILNGFNPHKRLALRGTNLPLFIHIRTVHPFILSVAILLDVIFPKGESDGRKKDYNPKPNKCQANLKQSTIIVKFNFLLHLAVKVVVEVCNRFFCLCVLVVRLNFSTVLNARSLPILIQMRIVPTRSKTRLIIKSTIVVII